LATRSGVAQPNIAAYETGPRTPSAAKLKRVRSATKPRPLRRALSTPSRHYRIYNTILDADDPTTVRAVVDWELSTPAELAKLPS